MTDNVWKHKIDSDRRYVKQVFIRSALKPHGFEKKIFTFEFEGAKFKTKRLIKQRECFIIIWEVLYLSDVGTRKGWNERDVN